MKEVKNIWLYFVTCFLVFPTYVQAQTAHVTLNCINEPISEVLLEIEEQTDYLFIYNKEKMNFTRRISLNYENTSLRVVLDDIIKDSPVRYTLEGNYIIFFLPQTTPEDLPRFIKGFVADKENLPVIGALIEVNDSTKNAVTDINGSFIIQSNQPLVARVASLGYKPQQIKLYPGEEYSIVLEEDILQIEEVIIIGYGSLKRKEVTSTISHLTSQDLLYVNVNNPIEAIQGKVAGVSISNLAPADPNSIASIQIRGASSRAAGLGPLIVINGVPGGNLNNVNINDIESIDILKDGAASAIYGTRGSNGVVLITTKQSNHENIITTQYNGYISANIINDQPQVLSRDEFLLHKRGTDYGHNTNWFKEITQKGITHNHSLTLSGGKNLNNYRVTIDHRYAKGVDLRSSRKETGGRINLNHQSKNKRYKISLNIAPRIIYAENANYGVYQQAILLNPTQPVKNPKDLTGKTYFKAVGFGAWNPVEALKTELDGNEIKYLDWDATFKLNLLPDFNSNNTHHLSTQITVAQQINDNFTYFFRPSTNTELAESDNKKGYAKRQYSKSIQESLQWQMSYLYEKNNHNLNFMAGYSYQYIQNSGMDAENYNFSSDALTYNDLGNGTWYKDIVTDETGFNSWKNDSKLIAFYGRLNYSYKGKYIFSTSLRYEGSSKFGNNHKWGYFPAVSGGWRISEENLMKKYKWINELKIRGDFGITGNQEFESYLSIPTMTGYSMVLYRGNLYQAWGRSYNSNPDLHWEKGLNWNVGIDFSLFSHTVAGSLNYYNRKSQDLLGWYEVPAPHNLHPRTFLNVGTMINSGLEIELNINAIKEKDLTYSIGFVGSTIQNKLKSFSNDKYQAQEYQRLVTLIAPNIHDDIQELREGKRIGNFHTYAYAGVDENGSWLVWNKGNTRKIPFSEARDEDKRVVGNGLPRFTASLNNHIAYKNIDLSVYLRGVFGFDIFNIHDCYYGLQGTSDNVLKKAYTTNAHIKSVNIPCDYFIEPGDYLKLDAVTLGYTFNAFSKWMDSIRIYMSGKNLITFTKFSGVDPQSYPVNGITPGATADRDYYPSTLQLLLGLQIKF